MKKLKSRNLITKVVKPYTHTRNKLTTQKNLIPEKVSVKIPVLKKYVLLGEKESTVSSNYKTRNQKKLNFRWCIKRTCENALMCIPEV